MATLRTFKEEMTYFSSPYNHFVLKTVNEGPTATRFRHIKPTQRLPDAGWHFSYLGGTKAAVAKVRAFNEMGLYAREDLEKYVEKRILQGRALFGQDHFLPETLDETFPKYVCRNRKRFVQLIFPQAPRQGVGRRLLWGWFRLTACIRRLIMCMLFAITPKCVRTLIKRILGLNF